mmetsp:Transcript_34840/g.103893  ORF Transcript_34840/g.103893 Transcript_34840/m.103893 type:complete len:201 (-) Transcript_34840:193-795(-)
MVTATSLCAETAAADATDPSLSFLLSCADEEVTMSGELGLRIPWGTWAGPSLSFRRYSERAAAASMSPPMPLHPDDEARGGPLGPGVDDVTTLHAETLRAPPAPPSSWTASRGSVIPRLPILPAAGGAPADACDSAELALEYAARASVMADDAALVCCLLSPPPGGPPAVASASEHSLRLAAMAAAICRASSAAAVSTMP